jgi:hypothetical protein
MLVPYMPLALQDGAKLKDEPQAVVPISQPWPPTSTPPQR